MCGGGGAAITTSTNFTSPVICFSDKCYCVHVMVIISFCVSCLGLSQLFQNNFGNNRLRLELENYSSLMGQNCVYKDYKRSKRCKREVQVIAGLGDIKTVYLTCVQVD